MSSGGAGIAAEDLMVPSGMAGTELQVRRKRLSGWADRSGRLRRIAAGPARPAAVPSVDASARFVASMWKRRPPVRLSADLNAPER